MYVPLLFIVIPLLCVPLCSTKKKDVNVKALVHKYDIRKKIMKTPEEM